MRILLVNKFHYVVGGSETYYFALKKLLEEHGHEIIEFSMKDERNIPSSYEDYFVNNVDYSEGNFSSKIKSGINIIYSFEAKKKFEQLVKDTKPDLIHLNLFQHQISPSILDVIKKYHIPTVYTAHELKMICPNYRMLNEKGICEKCKKGKYLNCVKNKCVKKSMVKSMICTVEAYLHSVKRSYDCIDKIITPSEFYKNKFIEFGVDSRRVIHIPNFLDREKPFFNISEDNEKYFLYFGRLSHEKGIMTLLDAVQGQNIQLKIVGTGELLEQIKIKTQNMENVNVLGFKSGQELIDLVCNCRAVVLPSEWYENGPYSAIEALQVGRPIIGARIGGIPELIHCNGALFESGNSKDLRNKILEINNMSEDVYSELKNQSEELYYSKYTRDFHYQKLIKIYECITEAKKCI